MRKAPNVPKRTELLDHVHSVVDVGPNGDEAVRGQQQRLGHEPGQGCGESGKEGAAGAGRGRDGVGMGQGWGRAGKD